MPAHASSDTADGRRNPTYRMGFTCNRLDYHGASRDQRDLIIRGEATGQGRPKAGPNADDYGYPFFACRIHSAYRVWFSH